MAVVAFMIGGVLGLICGLVGWLGLGMSIWSAIAIYFAIGFGFALSALLFTSIRLQSDITQSRAEA